MAQQQLLEAFRRGEIGPVTLVRRLIQCGLSAGAALALTLSLASPAAAAQVTTHRGFNVTANSIENAASSRNMPPAAANQLNNVLNITLPPDAVNRLNNVVNSRNLPPAAVNRLNSLVNNLPGTNNNLGGPAAGELPIE
jgi:hypothetical protein